MEREEQQKLFITWDTLPRETTTPRGTNYRPRMLKVPTLAVLFTITLSFVGLIEYALHFLPAADSLGIIEGTLASREQRKLLSSTIKLKLILRNGTTGAPPPKYFLSIGTMTLSVPKTLTPFPTTTPVPTTTTGAPGPGTITVSTYNPSGPSTTSSQNSSSVSLVYVFTNTQYFTGAFLSTVLAVLFALPWAIINAKVWSMEPFYQLANTKGATANSTFYMEFASPFSLLAPFKALLSGHWAPFAAAMLSMSTVMIVPLAPEFVSIRMEGSCDAQHTGCVASLSVFPLIGRVLEGILAFMAVCTIVLILLMYRRSNGLFSEPHSIAGLAILFNNQEVKADFREAVAALRGTKNSVYKPLARRKYRLGFYPDAAGFMNYGLIPLVPWTYQSHANQSNHPKDQDAQPGQALAKTYPHRKSALGLMIILLGLAILIIYYKLTDFPNSGFEKFMDSEGFGVRFLFTAIGVIISTYWKSIFKDIAAMEAFSHLSHRSAKARDSILIPKLFDPISAILPTLLRGHIFTALVAASAFLAEPLTICLANVHFRTGTTFEAFTICSWLSCSIIAVMLVTLVAIAFHDQPALPFKPNTIAAFLYYLAFSSIPEIFDDMATLDRKARNHNIRDKDLRYGMWTRGTDGFVTIDVEKDGE